MSAKKSPAWKKYDAAGIFKSVGAETRFRIQKGNHESEAVMNQFGQLLDADSRNVIELEDSPEHWAHAEEVKEEEPAA